MNRNGFTLVELLAVIIIISLLGLVVSISVVKIINNSRQDMYENQILSIKNAAEVWSGENVNLLPNEGKCIYITLEYLKNYGLLDDNILDSRTNDKINDNLKIKITNNVNEYDRSVIDYEVNPNDINGCTEMPYIKILTPTTGIRPKLDENGNFIPGSEFNIKVNSTVGWLTFFVLSNDGNYVNLIAQKNLAPDGSLAGENQTGDEWYSSSQDNRYGPQTAYTYLSAATSNWTNIPVIESFNYLDEGNQSNSNYGYKSIITKLDETSGNYITTITPLSSEYGEIAVYENMKARLPKYSEVGCTLNLEFCTIKSLWLVDYLKTDLNVTGGTSKDSYSYGYWLLNSSPYVDVDIRAGYVAWIGRTDYNLTIGVNSGIRPVITIKKSDLLSAM